MAPQETNPTVIPLKSLPPASASDNAKNESIKTETEKSPMQSLSALLPPPSLFSQ